MRALSAYMDPIVACRRCLVFIAVVAGIYVLHWARDILIPLAVAILLADLLAPVANALRRRHIPNAVGVFLLTAAVALGVLGGTALVSKQVLNVAIRLPDYRDNIIKKIRAVRGAGGPLAEGIRAIQEMSSEAAGGSPAASQPAAATTAPATQPVPVEMVQAKTQALSVASGVVGPIAFPLAEFGILLIYLFFLLLNREVIGHRVRWLVRQSGVGIGPDVVEEASTRVGRYLRMQLLVNVCYGTLVFVVFWFFGLPSAVLLAAVAALLRYVPYIGPLLALALPTLLALAVFPGWVRPLGLFACVAAAEGATAGVIEPLLYGFSTGVSSIGVVLTSFFWGWVWGPIGLILAMPITVWIVIVGRYIPGLRSLAILLGSEPINESERRATAEQ